MRAFHSFSTRPLRAENYNRKLDKQIDCIITIATLSCLQAERLDIELVLHTDELGERMFGFLPYRNIYRTLDKHKCHERFWASGKMLAHQHEPLGSVHYDMDAVIKKIDLVRVLENSTEDLVVEAHEYETQLYDYTTNKLWEIVPNFPRLDMSSYKKYDAFRCGLVKINSQELKDKYIKGYWKIYDEFMRHNPEVLNDKNFTPDIILEQSYLLNLVLQHNHSYHVLFGPSFGNTSNKNTATSLGFNHFMSSVKYDWLEEIKVQLKKGNPHYFKKSQQKIKEIVANVTNKKS